MRVCETAQAYVGREYGLMDHSYNWGKTLLVWVWGNGLSAMVKLLEHWSFFHSCFKYTTPKSFSVSGLMYHLRNGVGIFPPYSKSVVLSSPSSLCSLCVVFPLLLATIASSHLRANANCSPVLQESWGLLSWPYAAGLGLGTRGVSGGTCLEIGFVEGEIRGDYSTLLGGCSRVIYTAGTPSEVNEICKACKSRWNLAFS